MWPYRFTPASSTRVWTVPCKFKVCVYAKCDANGVVCTTTNHSFPSCVLASSIVCHLIQHLVSHSIFNGCLVLPTFCPQGKQPFCCCKDCNLHAHMRIMHFIFGFNFLKQNCLVVKTSLIYNLCMGAKE